MAEITLKMPKMGESVAEAAIISWLRKTGETIREEEPLLEVATDKVDSEIPAPCTGILKTILFHANDVVPVGEVIAIIDPDAAISDVPVGKEEIPVETAATPERNGFGASEVKSIKETKFYSPLVRSIAREENISPEELNGITGSGTDGRLRKSDVFAYLSARKTPSVAPSSAVHSAYKPPPVAFADGKDRIVEMDRMRQMIAGHMVFSKHTSPHVTSYIEVDVTDMVNWRNRIKDDFLKKYGEKLTFTPVFVDAVAKAIRDFPMINVSVDGKNIIVHKDIHIGIATALPGGNLIVPVVRHADQKNLPGLTREINALAQKARENKLAPDEIGGSTFTISNVGTFGSLMGTPIINQPEVAILATGIIKKRPEVLETPSGDVIAIRQMMYLSLSFDHRVVDGYLGGSFLRKTGDYLENFNTNQRF
ncbi:MAG: 2-oxo acid dehydrogenase subunit E2 [Sinomicrobium sp.]|nr:2-oxo acid dehydrogenase subunit E2 [Sinomicrobium sp.]